ncbi:MAG: hypothetical protein C5B59_05620 [Bacteroidetes bacterium]|nr:MAG: hypothetical protein C5B59_05620 [Bacteroidota bacterium]
MLQIIISLISGAVGGNLAGAILKRFNLGPLWNSVVGILGGGLGGQLLNALQGGTAGGASVLGNILSSGVGGGILMAIVGFIKGRLTKHA